MMDSWIKAAVFNINFNKGHGILGITEIYIQNCKERKNIIRHGHLQNL